MASAITKKSNNCLSESSSRIVEKNTATVEAQHVNAIKWQRERERETEEIYTQKEQTRITSYS